MEGIRGGSKDAVHNRWPPPRETPTCWPPGGALPLAFLGGKTLDMRRDGESQLHVSSVSTVRPRNAHVCATSLRNHWMPSVAAPWELGPLLVNCDINLRP